MKKLYILAWMLCIVASPLVAQQFFADTFYYRFDSYQLDRGQLRSVDSIAKVVQGKPHYFEVTGHTDNVGTDGYNQALSEQRARTIAAYLIDLGIDRERVGYRGFGTKKALGDNSTFDGRTLNRRADVAVLYLGPNDLLPEKREAVMAEIQHKIDSLKAIVDAEKAEEMAELENQLVVAEQIAAAKEAAKVDTIRLTDYAPFAADPSHNLLIIAPKGTRFLIPRNSFATEEKNINFTVDELYSRKEMMFAEVSTLSDQTPIETIGMLKLTANFEGTPIELKPDSVVKVTVPAPADSKVEGLKAYAARGGSQRSKRYYDEKGTTPAIRAVKISVRNWIENKEAPVVYNPEEKGYQIPLKKAGWINLGRPLADRDPSKKDTVGYNVICKVGGKLFPDNANLYMLGENATTFIPLKLDRAKFYMATGIEALDQLTGLHVVGVQYDEEKKVSYVAYRAVNLKKAIKVKVGKKPQIIIKLKFKAVDPEEYEQMLDDIGAAMVAGQSVSAQN